MAMSETPKRAPATAPRIRPWAPGRMRRWKWWRGDSADATTHRRILPGAQGLILGAVAGALFGVSDIAIKFLVDDTASGVLELISPWTAAALIASVVAFYASARALQIGPGVEVIALTSVAANLVAIVGGILVFRDSIGSGTLEIAARLLAFCLVIVGAALIPGPVRATNTSGGSPGLTDDQTRRNA